MSCLNINSSLEIGNKYKLVIAESTENDEWFECVWDGHDFWFSGANLHPHFRGMKLDNQYTILAIEDIID